MSQYLAPFFLLQSVGYLTFNYVLWVGARAPQRTLAFRILAVIALCMFVGSSIRTFAFYFFSGSSLIGFDRSHAELGAAIELLGILIGGVGWILKPLLFRSLRRPIPGKDYFYTFLNWLVISVPPVLLFQYFGYGAQVGAYASVAIVFIATKLLLELNHPEIANDSSLRVLRLVLMLLVATHLFFLAYNFYFIVLGYSAHLPDTERYFLTDLWMRAVRISLFFVVDLLCLFYWWLRYSTYAVHAQEDRKKIELAIKEKDLLIKNLINANALIQTGAMTAGLSHEINQFLARIQLDIESAKVQLAHRGVDHVLAILNRVLDANTGAAVLVQNVKRLFVRQDEELTECDIDNLVESVAQLYLARAKLSKIVLTIDLHANVQVLMRKTLMQQVISNLVINAIDALDSVDRQDKKITLETRLDGDRWVFQVTDNAMGVRPENAHKIFSLFSTSKSEGTGIGLWLSRYIVEQHGGYIRFTNIEPEGVMFWVDMPLKPSLSATGLEHPSHMLLP